MVHAHARYGHFFNKKIIFFLQKICFFKQIAVARSIFTLNGGIQLFWAAFDLPVTVVQLKVALGLEKLIFGH